MIRLCDLSPGNIFIRHGQRYRVLNPGPGTATVVCEACNHSHPIHADILVERVSLSTYQEPAPIKVGGSF